MKRALLPAVLIAACAATLSGGAAVAEPGGYGPSAPTGPVDTPGGFTDVAITKTVDGSGGAVAAGVSGASMSASVPEGAFSVPVQIEVTTPSLAAVAPALPAVGYSGYTAVAGLGFKVLDSSGAPLVGTFAKPIEITLTGSNLGVPGEKVLQLDGPSSATPVEATVGDSSVTVQLTQDPNLVVINPPAVAAAPTTTKPPAPPVAKRAPAAGAPARAAAPRPTASPTPSPAATSAPPDGMTELPQVPADAAVQAAASEPVTTRSAAASSAGDRTRLITVVVGGGLLVAGLGLGAWAFWRRRRPTGV